MESYQLYIGGEFTDAEGGETTSSINPYNNEPIADIPLGGERDAAKAVAAARKAFDEGPWPRMSGAERGELIGKAAAILKQRMKDYAALESLDSGGTINKCGADAFLAQRQLAYFGSQAVDPGLRKGRS